MNQHDDTPNAGAGDSRLPYSRPTIDSDDTFERQALACGQAASSGGGKNSPCDGISFPGPPSS